MSDIVNTLKVREMRRGAKLLRENPNRIDHDELAHLVANWLDAEAVGWISLDALIRSLNGIQYERDGDDAVTVSIGVDEHGNPESVIDTSIHAARIIAAISADKTPEDGAL